MQPWPQIRLSKLTLSAAKIINLSIACKFQLTLIGLYPKPTYLLYVFRIVCEIFKLFAFKNSYKVPVGILSSKFLNNPFAVKTTPSVC